MKIDLNCDLGESFGIYTIGKDESVMPFITSANIACGYHASDPVVMDKTIRMAKKYNVKVGAHPGYPDLQGFGRRNMDLTPEEIENMILYQIGALSAFTKSYNIELVHVKPHGALYNQAAVDRKLAKAIALGVFRFSSKLILVGLAGSFLIEEGIETGLTIANEGFPDRAYNEDGTLRSRRSPGAVLENIDDVVNHAVNLASNGISISTEAIKKTIQVDTLCLHGDHVNAGENAQVIRKTLESKGIEVHALV